MPNYAYLSANLKCPNCGTLITDLVWFQWGYCPGYSLRKEYVYRIGDSIIWKNCENESVPGWVYFENGGANIGDPSVKNILVKDSAQTWLKEFCLSCKHPLGGAIIEIINGVIDNAWIYMKGEFDEDADIYIRKENNILEPKPEWDDHPMSTLKDC